VRASSTEDESHGVAHEPVAAKMVCGIIASSESAMGRAENLLEEAFGTVDRRSEQTAFDQTSYYQWEMGRELIRKWVSFADLVPQDAIVEAKLTTNRLEKELARPDGSRTVNLDPGYIVPSRLVLATTKDYAHRIYLGKGIYAEVTLIYRASEFHPLEWTYPDYRGRVALDFFTRARASYLAQLSAAD
jgi:hypothetical protein